MVPERELRRVGPLRVDWRQIGVEPLVRQDLRQPDRPGRLHGIDYSATLDVPREVLVPLVLNTVLGFGLYYVVTRDDESCLRALSAFRQLAASLVEPLP